MICFLVAAMPSIDNSYVWAVNTCNAPNIGYSQEYRDQETVNGITYYDCSSFIWYALKAGGFPLTGSPFITGTMINVLTSLGFTEYPIHTTAWLPGDICWRDGHTEMVFQGAGIGDGYTMGAHSARLPLADQVSISTTLDSAKSSTFTPAVPVRIRWKWSDHLSVDPRDGKSVFHPR